MFATREFSKAGRYVYLMPGVDPNLAGPVARYERKTDLQNASAWLVFELKSTGFGFGGFVGGAFDGRYIYLVPNDTVSDEQGFFVRYDTQGSFSDTKSWSFERE